MYKNKFNARKVYVKGMMFDSKKEAERYLILLDMERRGEIQDLERQVKFEILEGNEYFRPVHYIADFQFIKDGQTHIIDVKGMKKGCAYQLYKIKEKLMYDRYKIKVQEI